MSRVLAARRVLLTFLTAVQLVLPAAVVVADVQPGLLPSGAAIHASARPGAEPRRAHPDDCVFCRFLAQAFTPLAPLVHLPATVEAECASAPLQRSCRPAVLVSPRRARSPPLSS